MVKRYGAENGAATRADELMEVTAQWKRPARRAARELVGGAVIRMANDPPGGVERPHEYRDGEPLPVPAHGTRRAALSPSRYVKPLLPDLSARPSVGRLRRNVSLTL